MGVGGINLCLGVKLVWSSLTDCMQSGPNAIMYSCPPFLACGVEEMGFELAEMLMRDGEKLGIIQGGEKWWGLWMYSNLQWNGSCKTNVKAWLVSALSIRENEGTEGEKLKEKETGVFQLLHLCYLQPQGDEEMTIYWVSHKRDWEDSAIGFDFLRVLPLKPHIAANY